MTNQLNLFGSTNPEEVIWELNELGYDWLVDLPQGKHDLDDFGFSPILPYNRKILDIKNPTGFIQTPYIPYRIQFPSGKILDEREIFDKLNNLEKIGFTKEEITNARTLYRAIHDENYNLTEKYKFSGHTFVSKEDEKETIKKYSEKPFWKN